MGESNGTLSWTRYEESWEYGSGDRDCPHLSATGLDQTPIDDENKVWVCDACGWHYRSLHPENAPPMVRVMRGVNPGLTGSHAEAGDG